MITFELNTETPEEMHTLLKGLNLEAKNESMPEMPEKSEVPESGSVQTEERLGEAHQKKAPDRNPLEDLINDNKSSLDRMYKLLDIGLGECSGYELQSSMSDALYVFQRNMKVLSIFRDYISWLTDKNVSLASAVVEALQ